MGASEFMFSSKIVKPVTSWVSGHKKGQHCIFVSSALSSHPKRQKRREFSSCPSLTDPLKETNWMKRTVGEKAGGSLLSFISVKLTQRGWVFGPEERSWRWELDEDNNTIHIYLFKYHHLCLFEIIYIYLRSFIFI